MATKTGQVLTITDASFGVEVEEAEGLVVVEFGAEWCGPCRMMAPILERHGAELEGVAKIGKVDVDANLATAERFNVRNLPTFHFFRGGRRVHTVIGAVPAPVLERRIREHL